MRNATNYVVTSNTKRTRTIPSTGTQRELKQKRMERTRLKHQRRMAEAEARRWEREKRLLAEIMEEVSQPGPEDFLFDSKPKFSSCMSTQPVIQRLLRMPQQARMADLVHKLKKKRTKKARTYLMRKKLPTLQLSKNHVGSSLSLNGIDLYGKNRLSNDGSAKQLNNKPSKQKRRSVGVKKPERGLMPKPWLEKNERKRKRRNGSKKRMSSGKENSGNKKGDKGSSVGHLALGPLNGLWSVTGFFQKPSTTRGSHLNFLSLLKTFPGLPFNLRELFPLRMSTGIRSSGSSRLFDLT